MVFLPCFCGKLGDSVSLVLLAVQGNFAQTTAVTCTARTAAAYGGTTIEEKSGTFTVSVLFLWMRCCC